MKKIKMLIGIALFASISINFISIREIVKHENPLVIYRSYFGMWRNGKFSKAESINKFKDDSTFVFLTIGQSNAAESCNKNYYSRNAVFNYRDGKLFKETPPKFGKEYVTGSVWPLLADKLIDSGYCKQVIIIPRAVGSTNIESWSSGFCHESLINTLDDLKSKGIKVTHILWHQGESDNGGVTEKYFNSLKSILSDIRNNGQAAPFFCSIASYTPGGDPNTLGVDTLLQQAQIRFINQDTTVLSGPNTDDLIEAIYRHDSQHFSVLGREKYAEKWFDAITMKRDSI